MIFLLDAKGEKAYHIKKSAPVQNIYNQKYRYDAITQYSSLSSTSTKVSPSLPGLP